METIQNEERPVILCETILYVPWAECNPAVKATLSYEKQKYNSVMDVHKFYCDNGNTSSF